MKKRGAMQLSINAIVVMIIAITILGLALGFIQKMFSGATSQMDRKMGEIEKQMVEEAKNSGEKLYTRAASFELKSGTPKEVMFAVTNTDDDEHTYNLTFECTARMGSDACSDLPNGVQSWVNTFESLSIDGGEGAVFPVEINAGTNGDFKVSITAYNEDDGSEHAEQEMFWYVES